jgi:hypothetical protein
MNDTTANRPSHRLFNVTGDGDNARWTDIGVAENPNFEAAIAAFDTSGHSSLDHRTYVFGW